MNQYQPQDNSTFWSIIWQYKYRLVFYTFVISSISFTVLYVIGAVPNELRVLDRKTVSPVAQVLASTSTTPVTNQPSKTTNNLVELPVRILIDKIGVDSPVDNPSTTNTAVLNNALLEGAVRYPGSGTLGHGNMFLFGHSSGIRIVNNQAYKTFNHLNNLAIGDIVRVQSNNREYTYKVTSVALVESSEELVDFSNQKNMLTLSTCNVFGEKQERFVVEAAFIKWAIIK